LYRGQYRWSCGVLVLKKQHAPVWRLERDCQAGGCGPGIRRRGGDTSSTSSYRGRRSAAQSNPGSDEHARAPVAPAEARRAECPERYARSPHSARRQHRIKFLSQYVRNWSDYWDLTRRRARTPARVRRSGFLSLTVETGFSVGEAPSWRPERRGNTSSMLELRAAPINTAMEIR
jgi:hypothetical protein